MNNEKQSFQFHNFNFNCDLANMHQEKCSLTWHTYSDHLKIMMKEFMMNEDFSDVTLVTEDKKCIKANINILSACSPVFKDILKKEKNFNQILYLRGIKFTEMESIMQYIYLGEATFYEERMDEFLDVAKSLEIKELCNAKPDLYDEPDDEPSPGDPGKLTEKLREENVASVLNEENQQNDRKRVVSVKEKKYECEQCHKTYSYSGALNNHKQSAHAHQGVKFACGQCDYQTTRQSSLTVHIQSKHENIKYDCDQCDYQATQKSNLTVHIQSKHEGVKFACNQCEYQATSLFNLMRHNQSIHDGVKYGCDRLSVV